MPPFSYIIEFTTNKNPGYGGSLLELYYISFSSIQSIFTFTEPFARWLSKLTIVVLIALLAVLATLLSTVLWGLVQGIPLSFSPSQFSMLRVGWRPFPVLASDASIVHIAISMTLLAALGLGAVTSCFVLLSLFLAKPFAIIGLVFFWALLDYTLTGYVIFWQRYLSPTTKTMLMAHWPREDMFLPYLMPPLWSSVVYFIFIIGAVCFFGWRRIKDADL